MIVQPIVEPMDRFAALHRDIDVATEMFIGYFTNSDPFTSENVGENNSFVIPISDVAQ